MKADYTHISILLDKSGSINSIKSDIIGGYNTFLEEQKKESGKLTVTQVLFDDEYELQYEMTDVKNIPSLTDKTFVPRGNTALLRFATQLIKETGESLSKLNSEDKPSKVLFVIITDGIENWSNYLGGEVTYTKAGLAEVIKHQEEKYNWKFVYLGANQDGFAEGNSMGMGKSYTYTANTEGVTRGFTAFSSSFKKYRAGEASADFAMDQEDLDIDEKDKK